MFYFQTNRLGFGPEFLGRVRLVAALASLAGVGVFNFLLKPVPLRRIFLWTSLSGTVLGLSQLLLITGALPAARLLATPSRRAGQTLGGRGWPACASKKLLNIPAHVLSDRYATARLAGQSHLMALFCGLTAPPLHLGQLSSSGPQVSTGAWG